MPRYAQPEELTPFAQLLTDYMWNRRPANRPPMSGPQLAAKLGVPKQSVGNWIMRGSVPPLETILVIMARLDIPMRALYDAYRNAGLTVPRWNEDDAEAPTEVHPTLPETPRARRQTKTPSESYRDDDAPQAPAPRPYVPPARVSDEEMSERQWQRLIAQTTTTLKEAGASESMIAEMIAHIRRRQADAPEPMAAHIIAEHSSSSPASDSEAGPEAGTNPSEAQSSQTSQPPSTPPSKTPSSKSPAGR